MQKSVFRLKGPSISSHNPLDGLSVQLRIGAQLNLTRVTMKRKETTRKVMNLPGNSFMLHLPVRAEYFLSSIGEKKVVVASSYADTQNKIEARDSHQLFNTRTAMRWHLKKGQLFHLI